MLRKHGVVGKFVEFYGDGVSRAAARRPRDDRQHVAPSTARRCAVFPVDDETLDYLRLTGRSDEQIALVEAYAKEQGLWHDPASRAALLRDARARPLGTVVPSLAGPERPQDRVRARVDVASRRTSCPQPRVEDDDARRCRGRRRPRRSPLTAQSSSSVTARSSIAAITSCTNTSNPSVMIGAGLLAKNAVEKGLERKPWVKTSLAPGSKVVTEYYEKARAHAVPRRARLQHRRLRLHDVHRQLGSAVPDDQRRRQRGRPGGRLGALGQPQLRGPHQPRGEGELPGLPAARRRLRPGRARWTST